jgi:hypothetical protein
MTYPGNLRNTNIPFGYIFKFHGQMISFGAKDAILERGFLFFISMT